MLGDIRIITFFKKKVKKKLLNHFIHTKIQTIFEVDTGFSIVTRLVNLLQIALPILTDNESIKLQGVRK